MGAAEGAGSAIVATGGVLDLQEFAAGYSDEGHPAYHPALLLKVWLYTYALGMTSSRRLEPRIPGRPF